MKYARSRRGILGNTSSRTDEVAVLRGLGVKTGEGTL